MGNGIGDFCRVNRFENRIFVAVKKETEKSIPEYLRNLRVQNAKQLLRGTGLSISQIADALGICNANYFCQIFKEDTGLTPSDYRRNCYEKENTKPSVL